MKVGIITLSCAYNYGAVLQAYATQQFISHAGYDAVLIDYITEQYQIDNKDFVYKATVRWRKNVLTRLIWKYTKHRNDLIRRDFFRAFVDANIRKTKIYFSNEELKLDTPDCHAFISGSDQIWNTDFSWDRKPDLPFFLDFVPDDRKKIAYSSSFGEAHMDPETKEEVRTLLSRYDAIAVRESSGKKLIEEMGLSARVVLDPTMLCDHKVWEGLAAKRLVKQDYVLLFQINPNKELIKSAKQFAKSKNLRLILLSANPAHKRVLGPGAVYMPKVEEWLSYFKYASYVLTDSFHACVFSTQFNRQFAAYVEERNIKRISSVLHLLGIENRMIQNATYADLAKVYDGEIDFIQVNNKLNELQTDSGDWLLKQLSAGKSREDERQ